jgi:aerobic carbon-monoxide dehydrogenase medium subunit
VIPAPFAYAAPEDLASAIRLLEESEVESRVLAGGQSLLPMMKLRLARPDVLVDLRRLSSQLRYIRAEGDAVVIGALTTHADIEFDPLLALLIPFMPTAARGIADPLIRSRGTFAGSLAHLDPFGDWPAVALALGAEVRTLGPEGERTVAIDEFVLAPYTTSLGPAEIIVEVTCPKLDRIGAGAYVKHTRHGESDFAVVGCCAVLWGTQRVCSRVRVAFSGLAASPHRDFAVEDCLREGALNEETIPPAASRAGKRIEPISDAYASGNFRRHLAHVLARRALTAAMYQLPAS